VGPEIHGWVTRTAFICTACMIGAGEVEDGQAMVVGDAQRLPRTARSRVASVEAAVGRPAHDELGRSSKVSAEHLVPVAGEQVPRRGREPVPARVKASGQRVGVV
jgi:hypothetical protein